MSTVRHSLLAPPADRPRLRPGISRRGVIRAFGALGFAGLATVGYGAGIEAESLLVTRYRLTPPRWPVGMRLSISVIADLHAGGPHMPVSQIRQIVETANLLNSDIVLLMGDYFATHRFVTERVPHPLWAAELARLQERVRGLAVFCHSYWGDVHAGRRPP